MSQSLDRYLYTIRTLHDQYVCVRSVDVAHYLGISKASVSTAVRLLRERGLVEMEEDGNLLLTDLSKARAEQLNKRVKFFQQLLTGAGVEPSQALRDAISFSWEMSEVSYKAFKSIKADLTDC